MQVISKIINLRKTLLINKPFQLSILGWFTLLSVVLIFNFYFVIWYFFYTFKNDAIAAGLPRGHVFFTFLNEQKHFIDQVFFVLSGIAFLLIIFGGLFLSHKVAGPLHRLTEHLKSHSKENITPLQFRKSDYFLEIEEAFNDFIKNKTL